MLGEWFVWGIILKRSIGVHEEGLEPSRLAALEPKSSASASSATRAERASGRAGKLMT